MFNGRRLWDGAEGFGSGVRINMDPGGEGVCSVDAVQWMLGWDT